MNTENSTGQVEDRFLIQYKAFILNKYYNCNVRWPVDQVDKYVPCVTKWLKSGTVLATS